MSGTGRTSVTPAPRVEWDRNEPSYADAISLPAVRDLLAASAGGADHEITAQEFVEKCAKVLPHAAPLVPVVDILGPLLYEHLGIKTGKTERRAVALPAGVALVGVLNSLARHGNEIRRVQQAADGCIVHAELRSNMWHHKGHLVVAVEQDGAGATVEAATKVPGQVFDWGRSKVRLQALFEDLTDARVHAAVGPATPGT